MRGSNPERSYVGTGMPRAAIVSRVSLRIRTSGAGITEIVEATTRQTGAESVGAHRRENRQRSTNVIRRRVDLELGEEGLDVPSDTVRVDSKPIRDRLVRMALRYEREQLALVVRQGGDRSSATLAAHQPGDDRRVDDALAAVDTADGIREHRDV